MKLNKSAVINDKEIEIKNNPYLVKNILSKKQIKDLIQNLFIENNLCDLITKKTGFKYPTERYLNVVKRGYKDCNLDKKFLKKALTNFY